MIGCEDPKCEIKWFHLACLQMKTTPKGKWFCPICHPNEKPKNKKKLIRVYLLILPSECSLASLCGHVLLQRFTLGFTYASSARSPKCIATQPPHGLLLPHQMHILTRYILTLLVLFHLPLGSNKIMCMNEHWNLSNSQYDLFLFE